MEQDPSRERGMLKKRTQVPPENAHWQRKEDMLKEDGNQWRWLSTGISPKDVNCQLKEGTLKEDANLPRRDDEHDSA
jgi:hypothetical protein